MNAIDTRISLAMDLVIPDADPTPALRQRVWAVIAKAPPVATVSRTWVIRHLGAVAAGAALMLTTGVRIAAAGGRQTAEQVLAKFGVLLGPERARGAAIDMLWKRAEGPGSAPAGQPGAGGVTLDANKVLAALRARSASQPGVAGAASDRPRDDSFALRTSDLDLGLDRDEPGALPRLAAQSVAPSVLRSTPASGHEFQVRLETRPVEASALRATVPAGMRLPAYLPAAVAQARPLVALTPLGAHVAWEAAGIRIALGSFAPSPDTSLRPVVAGVTDAKEVAVGGQPAAAIRLGSGWSVLWTQGDHQYLLTTSLPLDEALKIANSLQ